MRAPDPIRAAFSFIIDAKDNAGAEKRGVFVGPRRIVIVLLVPETLARDAHTLAQDLADDALHNDFVTGDAELSRLVLDLDHDLLGPLLVPLVVELLVLQLVRDDFLNNVLDLGGVKSLVLARLKSVRRQMRHARVPKVHHFRLLLFFKSTIIFVPFLPI